MPKVYVADMQGLPSRCTTNYMTSASKARGKTSNHSNQRVFSSKTQVHQTIFLVFKIPWALGLTAIASLL